MMKVSKEEFEILEGVMMEHLATLEACLVDTDGMGYEEKVNYEAAFQAEIDKQRDLLQRLRGRNEENKNASRRN